MKTNSIYQLLQQYKVVIPPIQRDYAQGRRTAKIDRIRKRFLKDIFKVLSDDQLPPLELDFVYGYTSTEKTGDLKDVSIFKPLDGQQRLTTLFLIHWLVAAKEGHLKAASETLKRFSYATRYTSRLFCDELIAFEPEKSSEPINAQIIDQPWFFSSWHSDPTILSMLVMLGDIEEALNHLEGETWSKLTGENPRIVFHLLPMDDLGLPDDLYIKMNSRGKELTDFEHFKSQFSELLLENHAAEFNSKIDKEWSDLFWDVFKDDESDDLAKEVDAGFLSFFWYITDILIANRNINIETEDWLGIIQKVYNETDGNATCQENVTILFESLDKFVQIEKNQPSYFNELFYHEESDFGINKTRIFFNNPVINLFRKCARTYGYFAKKNSFSVAEQLMLYAILYSEFEEKPDIHVNLRKLRNLFSSSEDQLRNEYLPTFLYNDVREMIDNYALSENSKLSKRQLQEEKTKDELILNHPELKETVYLLEDHSLLRGNISIFDLDDTLPEYAKWFHAKFKAGVDYFNVSRALLTIGDYSQQYKSLRRFGNGKNSVWRELFTQSEARKGFEGTKEVLKAYLEKFQANPSTSDEEIINEFLLKYKQDESHPKTWNYYYVKYPLFRKWYDEPTDGFYHWNNRDKTPYDCSMMFRKQFNGRHWSPFLLELSSRNVNIETPDNYGKNLQFTLQELIFTIGHANGGFAFHETDEYSKDVLQKLIATNRLDANGVLKIEMNEDGIDVEDRIEKCNDFLVELSGSGFIQMMNSAK